MIGRRRNRIGRNYCTGLSPRPSSLLLALFTCSVCLLPAQVARADEPLSLPAFELLDVESSGDKPSQVRYMGQPAKQSTIDLTPTNGFFDNCFQATDPQPMLSGDEPFIRSSFGRLARLSDDPGTARWHLWVPKAGQIQATFYLIVDDAETDRTWNIQVGDQSKSLQATPSRGDSPQPRTLAFSVAKPGLVTFTIDCRQKSPPKKSQLRYIRLQGTAIDKAHLLRVRWRPSAVFTRYAAPSDCPQPSLWVFETRATTRSSSYSPLTTPFGYFGTSFNHRQAQGGFNFSMWIARRDATQAPPISHMARLIGTGYPAASFSDFGHEGTGVKFRDAVAYQKPVDRVIQGFRVQRSEGVETYYGYVYDPNQKRWRLYGSGRKPTKAFLKDPVAAKELNSISLDSTGSFCEIPGPPNRQRSGDVVREMKRRGWFYGTDEKWHLAQLPSKTRLSGKTRKLIEQLEQGDAVALNSARTYYMDDYATEGWIGMRTGGMQCYLPEAETSNELPTARVALPEYLSTENTRQLFRLPVEFGGSKVVDLSDQSAVIEYELTATGENSKAVLWYGTVDALTFTPRKINKGSVVQKQMYAADRTWQHSTPERSVGVGTTRYSLPDLEPGTHYFYRLYVAHDDGKSWDYRSGSFRTQ